MKLLTSAAFGAAALAASLVAATPAEARTSFGVYVGGPGYDRDYSYDRYRYRCDDYWYRRRHPYRCRYAYDDDYDEYPSSYYYNDYYYPSFGFTFGGDRHRHYRHHRHHRHHHRW